MENFSIIPSVLHMRAKPFLISSNIKNKYIHKALHQAFCIQTLFMLMVNNLESKMKFWSNVSFCI